MRKTIHIPRAAFGGMTPHELRLGRFLRAPEDHPTGVPGAGDGNAPGNDGNSGVGSGTPGSDSNNTGESFDPASFWEGPAPEGQGTPSGESAPKPPSESGTGADQNANQSFSQQLTGQLEGLQFEPLFTPEIAAEINEGNFENVHKRFNSQLQAAVRHGLSMNVQILRPFAEQIMSQMRDEFRSTLSTRDDNDTLESDFPAAKNATVRPMIQQVYSQALKNAGGNRSKAVAQTKQMLSFMANQTAGDLDLSVAPRGSEDYRPQDSSINWLDELTGR